MKKLSESLIDLAGRVRKLEDSAAAVEDKNRAALQTRRDELDTAIEKERHDIEKATTAAKQEARTWWSDTKGSIERQMAAMRADVAKRQAEHKKKSAEHSAQDAEQDAWVAVTLAAYCLDAAEWAVVQAELARGEADELAATGSKS